MEAAQPQQRPPRHRNPKRDLTLALSASGAIFAGLVGTNILDGATSSHYMSWADHAAIVLWLPALLLLSFCAYRAPDDQPWQRTAAGTLTATAGAVTLVVLLFTGFGFTRDSDHVRLLLTTSAVAELKRLCGAGVRADRIDGRIRTATLEQEFVIFNFDKNQQAGPCVHSVDIPRADVLQIEEGPKSAPSASASR